MDNQFITFTVSVKWVKKHNGKLLAIVNGHTFYQRRFNVNNSTWSCTRAGKCRARLMVSNEDTVSDRHVMAANLDHNHEPPTFTISNGVFVKTTPLIYTSKFYTIRR